MYDENRTKCKTESIFFTVGKVYIIISECKKKLKFYSVVIVQRASNLAQWLIVKLDTGRVMKTCVIEIQCDSVVDLLNAQYP